MLLQRYTKNVIAKEIVRKNVIMPTDLSQIDKIGA